MPPVSLKPEAGELPGTVGGMKTRGLRQTVSASRDTAILFRYPDGNPAILRVPLGRGKAYYSAAALEGVDYGRLLDCLFSEAGVDRPVRVRPVDGGAQSGVEARFAELGSRKLLYVVNSGDQPVRLRVEATRWTFRSLHELREDSDIDGGVIAVPARQTALYEMLGCQSK